MVIPRSSISSQLAFLKRQLSCQGHSAPAALVSQALWILKHSDGHFCAPSASDATKESKQVLLLADLLPPASPSSFIQVDEDSFKFELDVNDVTIDPSKRLEDPPSLSIDDDWIRAHADLGRDPLDSHGSLYRQCSSMTVSDMRGLFEEFLPQKKSTASGMTSSSNGLMCQDSATDLSTHSCMDCPPSPMLSSAGSSSAATFQHSRKLVLQVGATVQFTSGRRSRKVSGVVVGFTKFGKVGVSPVQLPSGISSCNFLSASDLTLIPCPRDLSEPAIQDLIASSTRTCKNVFI